jgi:drug/metabolite transporter (DMT)-like permease
VGRLPYGGRGASDRIVTDPLAARPLGDSPTALIPGPVLPYAWMLTSALAFAAMGSLAHALGDSCGWQVVALARTALALLFATMLTLAAGARLVFLRPRILWVRSLAGSVSLVCTFYAISRLPVAEVLTLTNVFPIWVALLSWPLVGEVPSRSTWIAIAVGLLGVVLVEQPHFTLDELAPAHEPLAAVSAIISSMTTAVAMLGLHRLQTVDPRAIVVHFSAVALVVCLTMLALVPNTAFASSTFNAHTLSMLLAVGVCATVGQLFLTKAFRAGPPAKVSVVALTQAGFGMLFDVLAMGYSFSPLTLVGMGLVVAPTGWLLWSQGRAQADDL